MNFAEIIVPSIVGAGVFTLLNWLPIRAIERHAQSVWGAERMPRWKRLLIPLPIALFLLANLDGVLSFRSYAKVHPVLARYSGNEAWDSSRFFVAALVALVVVPILLGKNEKAGVGMIPMVWVWHIGWFFFVYVPLLLSTGVPLQN